LPPDDLFQQIERSRAQHNARFGARKGAKIPNGSGPPSGYRACNARPPPHIAVHRQHQLDDYRAAQLRAARKRGFTRTDSAGGLPWWVWPIAHRVHANWRAELCYLPRPLRAPIERAASSFTTDDAQASCAALGIVLTWLSIRHPRHCGEPSNVGGIPGALLRLLTERTWRDGTGPYSLSSVQHRTHTTGAVGDIDEGTVGFIEALRQAGALKAWVPPANHVPDWMRGEVYAFHVFRACWPELEAIEAMLPRARAAPD
jgi:hypothetical protein